MRRIKIGRRSFGLGTIVLAAVVALAGALAGAVKYSESPSFCRSCHIMEPYYQAWKASKHNQVACVECHYPPAAPRTLIWKKFQALSQVVKYVTRTYSSKPFAKVDDASCLRSGCHSRRLIQGKIMTKTHILFDHRPHLLELRRGMRLRCVSCHSQVMIGNHIEVTYATCFICHFKGRGQGRNLRPIAGCTGCHQVPTRDFKIGSITYNHKSFVARGVACQSCHFDIVQGDGAAPKERCLTCHNVPEILARYKDWKFIHKRHVTDNNIACLHCHEEIRHGFSDDTGALARLGGPPPPQRAKRDAVSIARLPTLAFDCSLCHLDQHKGQLELYSGQTSGLGLPIMPNPMFLARVDCSGCHYDQTKGAASSKGVHGVTFRASRQACVRCHGPRFKGLWESIHQELARTVAAMSANLDIVAKAVAAMPPADTAKRAAAQDAFSRARRLVDFIRDSHGDHNIYLAAVALRRAQRQTELAAQASNTQLNDLSDLPLINQTYCATLCHPKVGVKIPREIEHYKGKVMPHGMHARMLPCGQCHDMGVHRKAPLKPNIDAVCANCHQGSAP